MNEYRAGLTDVAAALNRIADAMENSCTCGGRGRPCYACSTAGDQGFGAGVIPDGAQSIPSAEADRS